MTQGSAVPDRDIVSNFIQTIQLFSGGQDSDMSIHSSQKAAMLANQPHATEFSCQHLCKYKEKNSEFHRSYLCCKERKIETCALYERKWIVRIST